MSRGTSGDLRAGQVGGPLQAGSISGDIAAFDDILSPETLTIGIARRFATYKRAQLFFRDFDWALRVLTSQDQPIQLIFSGKAHPRDDAGRRRPRM